MQRMITASSSAGLMKSGCHLCLYGRHTRRERASRVNTGWTIYGIAVQTTSIDKGLTLVYAKGEMLTANVTKDRGIKISSNLLADA